MENTNRKKIEINTRDFGKQEIFEDDIITFPKGLFAFEEYKKFVILNPLGDENSPMWLQSVDSATPCFIVFKPMELISNYSPEPLDEDLETISLEKDNALEVLSIAVIPEDYKKATINIKSPIIVNRNKKIAVQAILPQDFELKFPIYQSIEEG